MPLSNFTAEDAREALASVRGTPALPGALPGSTPAIPDANPGSSLAATGQFTSADAAEALSFVRSINPQTMVRAQVSLVSKLNPDAVAMQRKLAAYLDYPPGVGEALPDTVKDLALAKRVADDTANSHTLQKAYARRDFASIAHDDSGALKSVGTALEFLGKSAHSGMLSLTGVAAKLTEAITPLFTISEQEAATLFKNDPEGFKQR